MEGGASSPNTSPAAAVVLVCETPQGPAAIVTVDRTLQNSWRDFDFPIAENAGSIPELIHCSTRGMFHVDDAIAEGATKLEIVGESAATVHFVHLPTPPDASVQFLAHFSQNKAATKNVAQTVRESLELFHPSDEVEFKAGVHRTQNQFKFRRIGLVLLSDLKKLSKIDLSAEFVEVPQLYHDKRSHLKLRTRMLRPLLEQHTLPSVEELQATQPQSVAVTIEWPRFSTPELRQLRVPERALRLVGGRTTYVSVVGSESAAAAEHELTKNRVCEPVVGNAVNSFVLRGIRYIMFDFDGCIVAWPLGAEGVSSKVKWPDGSFGWTECALSLMEEAVFRCNGTLIRIGIVTNNKRANVVETIARGQPTQAQKARVEAVVAKTQLFKYFLDKTPIPGVSNGEAETHLKETHRKNLRIRLLLHQAKLDGVCRGSRGHVLLIDDKKENLDAFYSLGGHILRSREPKKGLQTGDLSDKSNLRFHSEHKSSPADHQAFLLEKEKLSTASDIHKVFGESGMWDKCVAALEAQTAAV